MVAHHVGLVRDLAAPELAHHAVVDLAPLGADGATAAELSPTSTDDACTPGGAHA